MSVEIDDHGFFKRLKQIGENAKALDGKEQKLTEKDLFPDSWMAENTKSRSWKEFVDQAPWQEEFTAENKEQERNKYVSENTHFVTWKEMVTQASHDYAVRAIFKR